MKPIAVQLNSLAKECRKDLKGVLRAVAEMGFAGVQPASLHGMPHQEFRDYCGELGLKIAGSHNANARPDQLRASIYDARALGQNLVHTSFPPRAFFGEETILRTAHKVNYCVEMLAEQGLRLFIHNSWWEFQHLPEGRLKYELFAELCPNVEFEIDIYWASNFGKEDPAFWIDKFKQRTTLLHVKDGLLERMTPNTALGQGKIDVKAAILAADPNVLEWLIVELDACAGNMQRAIKDSFDYLVREGLGHGRT